MWSVVFHDKDFGVQVEVKFCELCNMSLRELKVKYMSSVFVIEVINL